MILEAIRRAVDPQDMIVFDQDNPVDTVTKRLLFYMHRCFMETYAENIPSQIYIPQDTYSEIEWDTRYLQMLIIPTKLLNDGGEAQKLYKQLGGTYPPHKESKYNRLIIGMGSAYDRTIVGACCGPQD